MRFGLVSFLGLVLLGVTGCAGYHLGPVESAAAGRSIEVFPFNNQTLQLRFGDAVTQSLRERLQADGTYHLATHGEGDVVVTGTIKGFRRAGLSYLSADITTTVNYREEVVAHVVAREGGSGRIVLEKDINGYTLLNVGTDISNADRQAQSLLADDLARNITQALTEGNC